MKTRSFSTPLATMYIQTTRGVADAITAKARGLGISRHAFLRVALATIAANGELPAPAIRNKGRSRRGRRR